MATKAFVLKNMSAVSLARFAKSNRACPAALEWQKGKDLRTVWKTCPNPGWLLWVLGEKIFNTNPRQTKLWGGLAHYQSFLSTMAGVCTNAEELKLIRKYYKVEGEASAKKARK